MSICLLICCLRTSFFLQFFYYSLNLLNCKQHHCKPKSLSLCFVTGLEVLIFSIIHLILNYLIKVFLTNNFRFFIQIPPPSFPFRYLSRPLDGMNHGKGDNSCLYVCSKLVYCRHVLHSNRSSLSS